MSCHRENVTWKSADGTWSIGFYEVIWTDPDGDPEWDVEYGYDTFDWCSTGHASEDAAYASWDGANPGGTIVIGTPGPETERLDAMAKAWKDANPPVRRYGGMSFGGAWYSR